MVKKTRIRYLLRSIKKTGVSFFAVALIAATSIAIYLGIQAGAQTILEHTDDYYRQNRLASFEIACANGITVEDASALAALPEVDTLECGYRTTALFNTGEERITVQVRSLLNQLNRPDVLEGQLPQAAGEVAIEKKMADVQGLSLGDELRLEHNGELRGEVFRVTAIINEPSFICIDFQDARGKGDVGFGSAAYYVELAPAAFDEDYYDSCYSHVYIESPALRDIYFYSDEYTDAEAELLSSLEAFGTVRAQLRYDELTGEVNARIAEAEGEIADAEDELSRGRKQLEDSRAELDIKRTELDTALGTLCQTLKAMGLSEHLDEAKTQLNALGGAGSELLTAISAYEDGVAALEEAEADIVEGEKKLADSEAELANAREKLEEARAEAADIAHEDWSVSGRYSMGDVSGVEMIVEGLFTLSYSFALIFLLVAVVVCYASVVKMIDDQKSLIGAQKALGFTSGEIFRHYLAYNMLSGLLGIIIGCVASVYIVEILVLFVFGEEFTYSSIPLTFAGEQAGVVALLCMAIFVAATCAGCLKVVRQPAVALLRGEMPTQKKAYFFESWGIYKKAKLYTRTMIKNVLCDRGRILTTIMGVVGCISLLIITFTLKFSISGAPAQQFKSYFLFENRLAVDSSRGDMEEYERILTEAGIPYARIQDKLETFRAPGENWENMHVIALHSAEQVDGFIRLEDVDTGDTVALPEDGVLVSRKCADNYSLEAGSTIELMDASGKPHECRIAGVIEHYLPYHQIVTTVEYYESLLGKQADECILLLRGDITGLRDKVSGLDGFVSLKDNSEYLTPFNSINLVIAICVFFSAILAVLVLLNQMTMYINRKSRELAVMRINGYTIKETRRFISRDNVFLVALGLIVGCLIGTPLAQLEVIIMETGPSRYIRTPNLLACALSAAVCIVFALIINQLALRRINRLSLTNVNSN